MKTWPAIAKQLLAVAILSMAAMPASAWAPLYCYYFGSPVLDWLYNAQHTLFQVSDETGERAADMIDMRGPAWAYFIGLAITVIWAIGLGSYVVSVRRNVVGLMLAILPAAAFIYFSWQQLLYAYPVCNAF